MDKQHQNMVRIQITDYTRKAGDKQHQDMDKIQPKRMQNEGWGRKLAGNTLLLTCIARMTMDNN